MRNKEDVSITAMVHVYEHSTYEVWEHPGGPGSVVSLKFNDVSIMFRNWQHLADVANDMLNAARVHLEPAVVLGPMPSVQDARFWDVT